jgi:hypothetical protein
MGQGMDLPDDVQSSTGNFGFLNVTDMRHPDKSTSQTQAIWLQSSIVDGQRDIDIVMGARDATFEANYVWAGSSIAVS